MYYVRNKDFSGLIFRWIWSIGIILLIAVFGIHYHTRKTKYGVGAKMKLTNETFIGRPQEDPSLVSYIRQQMYRPSTLPYNLSNPDKQHFSQYNQSGYAEENFLRGMKNGFFVEAAALDGENMSTSLFFEKYRGWKGLLVEPDPFLFRHLSQLHRKAYTINAGFSLNTSSGTTNFVPQQWLEKNNKTAKNGIKINVFPFFSMLLALGVNRVDFFSLDIQGNEAKVLNTLPWDKVKFRLICMNIIKYEGGRSAYVKYFEDHGYTFLGVTDNNSAWFGLRELLQKTMDVDDWLKKNKKSIKEN